MRPNSTPTSFSSESCCLTIGMPVYNGEAFIADAINSLLTQTMADFRLLISDNCSTDNTEKICLSFAKKDPRIRYFRHPVNRGAEANFRFVLDCASSPFFMWAAADDLWSTDYLQLAIHHLDSSKFGFCFPTFTVCSIKNGSYKLYPRILFSFVESPDRKKRIITFLSLHHLSHKCNLVYSCFQTSLLKAAYDLQDISNDGVLATVILGLSPGYVLDGYRFSKRCLNHVTRRKSRISLLFPRANKDSGFNETKKQTESLLFSHFPEYQSEINHIFSKYRQSWCRRDYIITKVNFD